MMPGVRTSDHLWVGDVFEVKGEDRVGICVSVTPWGNGRIRWVRLRHHSAAGNGPGLERSYAPSQLIRRK